MDIRTQTISLQFGAIKTAASYAAAQETLVPPDDPIVQPISTDVAAFRDQRHRVLFGNCLHRVPGGFAMWSSQDSKVACGEDHIWTIPDACLVAATRVGVCPGNAPAWAVEVRA